MAAKRQYSQKQKDAILRRLRNGHSVSEVSRTSRIPRHTLYGWLEKAGAHVGEAKTSEPKMDFGEVTIHVGGNGELAQYVQQRIEKRIDVLIENAIAEALHTKRANPIEPKVER